MLLIDGSLILVNSKEDNIDVIWLSSSNDEFDNFCNKVGMSLKIEPYHFKGGNGWYIPQKINKSHKYIIKKEGI